MRVGFILPDKANPWDSVNLGIGYVEAYGRSVGVITESAIFRTCGTEEHELIDFLRNDWDIVACTTTNAAMREIAHIGQLITNMNVSSFLVVGGPQVMTFEEKVFENSNIDFAINGEGEITFAELLTSLKKDGDVSGIKGLIYRDLNNTIIKNSYRDFYPDLDIFPFPDRQLFNYKYNFHSVIGTRGCPFSCMFCNSSANYKHTYRLRSPENIAGEISQIIDQYGHEKYFAFSDDSFNLNKEWVLSVCHQLKEFNIRWWIRGVRPSLVTEDVADALAEAGCFGSAVGIESVNNNCLKFIRKQTTFEDMFKGCQLLMERGINVNGQFIIGNPKDTFESFKKALAQAEKFLNASFGIALPIYATDLYKYVVDEGYMLDKPEAVFYDGQVVAQILFATPEFTVEERVKAIYSAIDAGFYHKRRKKI